MVAGASSLFFSARRVRIRSADDGGFAEGGGQAGARWRAAEASRPCSGNHQCHQPKPEPLLRSQCFTRAVDSAADRNAAMLLRYIWHPSIKASYT